jgi:hypothetical protein
VQAEEDWQKSRALIRELPGTGAEEYERDCLAQMRAAIDTKTTELAAVC